MFNLEIFLSGKQYFYNFEMHSMIEEIFVVVWEIKQSTKLDKMFGFNFFMTDWYFLTFVVQSEHLRQVEHKK